MIYRVGGTRPISTDARLLAASNDDLQRMAESGSFRRDLYFRLNEFTLRIPPLRERQQDLPYLAKRFLDITNIELSKAVKGFSPLALQAMLTYGWPGNVRQLRSVVRRAVLLADQIITEQELELELKEAPAVTSGRAGRLSGSDGVWQGLPLREIVRRHTSRLEQEVIAQTLQKTGGNKAKAARLLQIDYKTLHSKVREYGTQIEGD